MRIAKAPRALLALPLVLCAPAASQSFDAGSRAISGPPPKVHNRQISSAEEAGRALIRLDERPGNGVAWWPESKLSDGTIEFDLRGKNIPQRSFVGVAFHGLNETTYDVVYFRPFNFRAADDAARNHAVQYVSLPEFDWQKLRLEHPGQYEKALSPQPEPDQWLHARIVIVHPKVSVFVDGGAEPVLVVNQLSSRTGGWVGLWVGNGSGGDFANLKISSAH